MARLVSNQQARRSVLVIDLGAVLLRHDPAAVLAKGKRKGNVTATANAQTTACCLGTDCALGTGWNASGCDFSFAVP